jgi:hypothetical protein
MEASETHTSLGEDLPVGDRRRHVHGAPTTLKLAQ